MSLDCGMIAFVSQSDYQNSRQMAARLSKTDLQRLYWLSGSPCAGKTTISTAIAHEQDWQIDHCDDWEDTHRRATVRKGLSNWDAYSQLTGDALWLRPIAQHVSEALQAYWEQFTLIVEEIVGLLHHDKRHLLYDGYVDPLQLAMLGPPSSYVF